jgi:V8-like Glu-specific endopeptidase
MNKVKKMCKGTAVAISKNLIFTVAHNVYDRNYGCQFENWKFYLGADGEANRDVFHEIEAVKYLPEFKECR